MPISACVKSEKSHVEPAELCGLEPASCPEVVEDVADPPCDRAGADPELAGDGDVNFGWIFAAYGGIFIVGSILWGMAFEGCRPDRFDLIGGAICLAGMAVIMYAPRG